MFGTPRMLVAFALATVGTVGLIVVLATGAWWALPIALLGHVTGFITAMKPTAAALNQEDKPDPVTEARIEEEQDHHKSEDTADDGGEPRLAI